MDEEILKLAMSEWSAGGVYIGPDLRAIERIYRAAYNKGEESMRQQLAECEQKRADLATICAISMENAEHRMALQKQVARLEGELAECEADCLEQARLNGMGSEREARLMARLEECERELKEYKADHTTRNFRVVELVEQLATVTKERDELVADAKRYQKALIDLSVRGYGVRRPKWLIATINHALAKVGADKTGEGS